MARPSASPEALEGLVRMHLSMVYSVAVRQVGDGHLAEDVSEAVFLPLWQRYG